MEINEAVQELLVMRMIRGSGWNKIKATGRVRGVASQFTKCSYGHGMEHGNPYARDRCWYGVMWNGIWIKDTALHRFTMVGSQCKTKCQ